MTSCARSEGVLPSPWPWPISWEKYDRTSALSEIEQWALHALLDRPGTTLRQELSAMVSRLLQPLDDILAYMSPPAFPYDASRYHPLRRLICLDMHQRKTAFWAWSQHEWLETLGPERKTLLLRRGETACGVRPMIPAVAYLANAEIDVMVLAAAANLQVVQIAQKVFGAENIETAVEKLKDVLARWGYLQANRGSITLGMSYVFLLNKSPLLEDLTMEVLEQAKQQSPFLTVRRIQTQISRALTWMGIIGKPLPRRERPVFSGLDGTVANEWLAFCQRWRQQTTRPRESRNGVYYLLLKAGRWLHAHHPDITSPAQWTNELALDFVTAVCNMNVGEWADTRQRHSAERYGQPLLPRSRQHFLSAMVVFFRDCQEWGWIPIRLNPHRVLRLPSSIRRLIGPDPRVIDKSLWAKLLWAAMSLQKEDLLLGIGKYLVYPFEMVRAIAIVWCFTALRSNEISRLRMGCIRWQHEDVMIPETGGILPKDAVCFLDIPVNKTDTAYTKAVHPLVGKAITEWEQTRPKEQFPALDKKTGEVVHFLFSYRGVRISPLFINSSLIPLLCGKAGIPEQDSRGHITSHRARATIASQLYNAKEPLDILQLKEYLGHKSLSSTQSYVKVDPTKLASKIAQAGYFEHNMAMIEVLLDQDAVMNGAAARGEIWKYYDLGHGYCTHVFWAECKHRMACARCPFYRPKTTSLELLVEGKANLVRMLEYVKLTEDERLLVTEGMELHQSLIEKLANSPTPADG